jgi:hypothetical protein
MTASALAVLCGVGALVTAAMAITGKPRLIWGRRGDSYFTRGEQAVVCLFETVVLLFAGVVKLSASLPSSKVAAVLSRMDQLIGIPTFIFLLFSVMPLVWGVSQLSHGSSRRTAIDWAINIGSIVVGGVVLLTNLFQIVMAVRSSL